LEALLSPSDARKASLKAAEKAIKYLRSKFLEEEETVIVDRHERDVSRKIDLDVEDIIIKTLKEEGFKGSIVTEERGVIGEGPPYAIIDPLDGSLNFSIGSPYFAVSIAISEGNTFEDVIAGALCPSFGHPCYSAEPGKVFAGAMEMKPLSPENVFIYYGEPEDEQLEFFKRAYEKLGRVKVRTPGAIALDLLNLARGKVLAVADVRNKLRNIDIASAYLMIRELGLPVLERVHSFPADRIDVIGDILFARDEETLKKLLEAYSETLAGKRGWPN